MGLFGIAVALLAAKARRADILTAVAQRATVGLPHPGYKARRVDTIIITPTKSRRRGY
jgi:hypothetical protein